LANLVPIIGVYTFGWQVFPILLFFWIENVVIGVFNILKMLRCQGRDAGISKWFMAFFFMIHYGAFTMAHGVVLLTIFGKNVGSADSGLPLNVIIEIIRSQQIWLAALSILISHGFSFIWNYLGKKEYLTSSLGELMTLPYRRIIIMHVGLILGAFVIDIAGSPPLGLLIFIILKIIMDIPLHLREHRKKYREAL
jgi:hypothetical protein